MTPPAPRCRPDGFRTRHAAARRAWKIAEVKRVVPYQCEQCGLWHLAAPDPGGMSADGTTDTKTGGN